MRAEEKSIIKKPGKGCVAVLISDRAEFKGKQQRLESYPDITKEQHTILQLETIHTHPKQMLWFPNSRSKL